MYYIISSCLKYHKSTYPVIAKSLLESGIQSSQIIFVVGGSETETVDVTEDGISMAFVAYNSFDLTGLIYTAENIHKYQEYNNFFLLHDTCEVLPYFKEKSEEFNTLEIIKPLSKNISMNIGMYSSQCLTEQLQVLQDAKYFPTSAADLQNVKNFFVVNEDILFNKYQATSAYNSSWKVLDEIGYYNKDNIRTVELFEDIGIVKIKANTKTKAIWNVEL
jgi:hypothetical protein